MQAPKALVRLGKNAAHLSDAPPVAELPGIVESRPVVGERAGPVLHRAEDVTAGNEQLISMTFLPRVDVRDGRVRERERFREMALAPQRVDFGVDSDDRIRYVGILISG